MIIDTKNFDLAMLAISASDEIAADTETSGHKQGKFGL